MLPLITKYSSSLQRHTTEIISLTALSFVFLFISLHNLQIVSPFDGLDAGRHIYYVHSLQAGLGIPHEFENGAETYLSHHPPLYYYLASFIIDSSQTLGSLKKIQIFNLLTSLCFIWVCYLIVAQVTGSRAIRLLSSAFLTLSPVVNVTSLSINNEILSQTLAAFAILFFIKFYKNASPILITLSSISLALAINTKVTHLILFPVFFLFTLLLVHKKRQPKHLLFFIPLIAASLSITPFMKLNWERYGVLFPKASEIQTQVNWFNYFTTFDSQVFQSPFYPTGFLTSFWSTIYLTTFSDYAPSLHPPQYTINYGILSNYPLPDKGTSLFRCAIITQFPRAIECQSYQAYLALVNLAPLIVLLSFVGLYIVIRAKDPSPAKSVFVFSSAAYFLFQIALVINTPDLAGGIVRSSYILLFFPFFYFCAAVGARTIAHYRIRLISRDFNLTIPIFALLLAFFYLNLKALYL